MSIEFTVFKGSASNGIVESKTLHEGPTGNQVLVKITHSHADMGLGHEGVGTVEQIGDRVSQFKIGDVVGWGYTHNTCGECEQCLAGQEQYCQNKEEYGTHNLHQGSFGSHAIWNASFLFKAPEALAPEHAAPLMCGGASVFEAIEHYNIRPTDRVGVVGVGGLGHLAIQFLAKMGSSVAVFSTTESKRDEALSLGATEFYATQGVDTFEGCAPLDHLLVTSSTLPDWKPFLKVMKPNSTIYPLTVSSGDLVIPMFPVVSRGINIQGSAVAGRAVLRRMLEFAAQNHIAPIVERFPMTRSGVEEGLTRLGEGKMRYRGVLVAA